MRRTLIVACVVFAATTGALASVMIIRDREISLRSVEERTESMARMIVAHGDAALDAAQNIVTTMSPLVAQWDLQDNRAARDIFAKLREPLEATGLLSSAWVLDGKGLTRLDTWTYPPKPIDGSERAYFRAHVAGADDPVVLGDERPGSVTGRQRFTYSQAIRNPDGSLHAVIVVAIYRSNFDTLYREAANWPGATAGLQTMDAVALARFDQTGKANLPEFMRLLSDHARNAAEGTAVLTLGTSQYLTSWKRSERHPQIYGSSSQTVTEALRSWQSHAWTVGLPTLAANAAFIAFAVYAFRADTARRVAQANELAVRETNHRVKNSLQMIASLVAMRARKIDDEGYHRAAEDVTSYLTAVAETYRFVQSSASLDTVDIVETLTSLCRYLQQTYDASVALEACKPVLIDAGQAATIAVVVNELVTNGIKHGGGGPVAVICTENQETLRIAVKNSGSPLPKGFAVDRAPGFGLKAVRTMILGLGGRVDALSDESSGAVFEVAIPMSALRKKQRHGVHL